ncbi:UDP-N-acetylmuramoyl-L-alanyl-D-glutamate--2,6-diaminopimelate ligase [Acidobacteriota bacterium]
MKLYDVMADIAGAKITGTPETEIKGIAYSSLQVSDGFLFAAFKGEKADGNDFIDDALSKGASAVLSENPAPNGFTTPWIQAEDAREVLAFCAANFYGHPSREMKTVGITGTKGKTTISYLLESICSQAGFKPGVIGTISYRGPGLKIEAKRTTPEAPDLQEMMNIMRKNGGTHCLLEVSSHSLDFKRVEGIGFDVAVFTNLSGEHMDYHQNMDIYFEAKKRLFFIGEKNRIAVVNTDDPWGEKLKSILSFEVISYGLNSTAMVQAEKYSYQDDGIQMQVKFPAGTMTLISPLLGRPNVYNILAAVSAAISLDIPIPQIEEGVRALKGIPGRFQRVENDRDFKIFVDYAHTDDALKNLLETANDLNPRRTIVVFGAGGDRDKSKRFRMGEVAGRLADWSIITSDNPRSEDPLAIISEIERGIQKTGHNSYEIIPDRREAISKALEIGEKDDCILIAGKGHENYQIIKETVTSFDDVLVVKDLLETRENT